MLKRLRIPLACAVLALCVIGISACGSAGTSSNATSEASSAASPATGTTGSIAGPSVKDGDGDDDRLGSKQDPDTDEVVTYGAAASSADRQAITSLITRYYAAAAAGDARRTCKMLYWLVAETVVEEHNHGRGPASLRGHTCVQVASKVFKQRHLELVEDGASLRVTEVQVRAKKAWGRLHFGPTGELLVVLHNTNGVWQMNNLLDAGPI